MILEIWGSYAYKPYAYKKKSVTNISEQFSISYVEDIKSFTLWLLLSVTT